MNKKVSAAALVVVACALLGACNDSPSRNQPITGDHPAPAPTTATADTIKPDPAAKQQVPFVNGTKVGRALGNGTPSPPDSRTHR